MKIGRHQRRYRGAAPFCLAIIQSFGSIGCSSSATSDAGSGGSAMHGSSGGTANAGSPGSGGTVVSGAAGSAGTTASPSGGTGVGGNPGMSGGTSASGGAAVAGNAPIAGNVSFGGNAGGTGTGGTPSFGGKTATGGASGAGGAGKVGAGGSATGGAGGTATGGRAGTGGTTGSGGAAPGAGGTPASGEPFNPPYILGADISWTLEQESTGAKYQDNGQTKSVERIFADHGFNFIRLRTFVCPNCPGGYDSNLYSGAGPSEHWCDTAHTIKMAKRVKACNMGIFLDFHMSDNWASIGHQDVPSAWAGMSPSEMQKAAHDYVKGVLQEMAAAGVKPDMVQVGNETNSAMSGVSMSNWANFSGLVNAGIRAVREVDPKIPVWAQHGRPRPDGGFEGWVDRYLKNNPPVDVDGICGSTYGTTNNGDDWRQEFGYVINNYKLPVMSCEYTDQRRELINSIMHGFPNKMGRGTFLWEPTSYSDYPLFDRSGSTFKTNSRMAAYDGLAKSYGLPVPSTPAAQLAGTTCQ